jgi:uncharacterized membrane protein YheB (UPF0754 family)
LVDYTLQQRAKQLACQNQYNKLIVQMAVNRKVHHQPTRGNIIQQNNFTNTHIKVLGEKLERIENQINLLTFKNQEKEIERLLFIPYETFQIYIFL